MNRRRLLVLRLCELRLCERGEVVALHLAPDVYAPGTNHALLYALRAVLQPTETIGTALRKLPFAHRMIWLAWLVRLSSWNGCMSQPKSVIRAPRPPTGHARGHGLCGPSIASRSGRRKRETHTIVSHRPGVEPGGLSWERWARPSEEISTQVAEKAGRQCMPLI